MKTIHKIAMMFLLAGMLVISGCNKNYYSGGGKSNKNCGCPGAKQ